ncbi:MAG: hypothetical protein IPP51_14380 [Bacteroidetes bacterium]|nr:hypothetical protein [Bacteroidota bacterium]
MIENTHPKTRNYQTLLLLLFVCLDLGFSFLQHYHVPIDGDMAESVMPSAQIKEVFDDPYGHSVFKTHIPHTNPNRYFAHATLNSYFRTAPFFLQKFVDPITSVYLASALFKIVLQILLLYVFSFYVKGKLRLFDKGVLLCIALLTPWFQTHGSKHYMGIIDDATSYVFFYALPLLLMMVFYLPFYLSIGSDKSGFKSIVVMVLWPLLALYLALSGPLNPGIILVVNLLIGVRYVLKCVSKKALSDLYKISYEKFILVLITLLSLYSLYIGTFNSSNLIHTIPLSERYEKIPEGILHLSRSIFGLPALLSIIVINLIVIRKQWREQEEAKKEFLRYLIGLEFSHLSTFFFFPSEVTAIIALTLSGTIQSC